MSATRRESIARPTMKKEKKHRNPPRTDAEADSGLGPSNRILLAPTPTDELRSMVQVRVSRISNRTNQFILARGWFRQGTMWPPGECALPIGQGTLSSESDKNTICGVAAKIKNGIMLANCWSRAWGFGRLALLLVVDLYLGTCPKQSRWMARVNRMIDRANTGAVYTLRSELNSIAK
ncbi:hypothetical protein LY76DRAFT_404582 [Colletotrichum caudatum]|nr:hypothetical protein LY76DRAFT_404582 [Colletotrichum caudatum]